MLLPLIWYLIKASDDELMVTAPEKFPATEYTLLQR